jgi:hypothetical protein
MTERVYYNLYKVQSEVIDSGSSMQVHCLPDDLLMVMARYMHYKGGGHFEARDVDDNIVANASFILVE